VLTKAYRRRRPVTILGAGHKMRPVAIADLLIGHVLNVSEAVYAIMRVITKHHFAITKTCATTG
jgi:hypothetical protein